MSNKVRDIVASVVMLAFGIFVYAGAANIRNTNPNDVGSAYVPHFIGICIVVAALAKLILSIKDNDPANKIKHKLFEDNFGGIATIVLMFGYMMILEPLGFIVASAIYLFLQILLLSDETNRGPKNRNVILFAIIAIIMPIAIEALFVYVIKMVLPVGLIGFSG